jgi:hypothetical protein
LLLLGRKGSKDVAAACGVGIGDGFPEEVPEVWWIYAVAYSVMNAGVE